MLYLKTGSMKKWYDIFFIAALILVIACAPTVKSATPADGEQTATSVAEGRDGRAERIVFGRYCGKCRGHCATMYQLNMAGSSNTLFMDTTDSFRDNFGMPSCNTPVKDPKKLALANSIVSKIPAELYNTESENERFGCPDCADGCGLYFQVTQGKKIKQFYIDTDVSQLKGNIKDFAIALTAVIDKISEGLPGR